MTYAEKLKDPRWQRKRLEVFQRDDFTCKRCGAENKTLHVHHLRYKKNASPWEIELKYLVTVCEACHEKHEHEKASPFHRRSAENKTNTAREYDPAKYFAMSAEGKAREMRILKRKNQDDMRRAVEGGRDPMPFIKRNTLLDEEINLILKGKQ